MRHKHSVAAGIFASILSTPLAAAWSGSSAINAQTGHSSNVVLGSEEDSARNSTVGADLKLRSLTELSSVNFSAGASYTRYSGAAGGLDDTDSQYADLAWRHRNQRVSYGLVGRFRRDELLRREGARGFDDLSPNDPLPELEPPPTPENDDLERNVVSEPARRVQFSVSPSVQFRLTQRNRLRLSAGIDLRRYSGDVESANPQSQLRDSDRFRVGAEWTKDLNQRSALQTSISQSFLNSEGVPDSSFQEARIGWRYKPSERSAIGVALGVNHIDSEFNNDWGFLFDLNGRYRSQLGRTTLQLRRTVLPNAFGNPTETDLLRLRHARKFAQSITGQIELRGVSRERSAGLADNSRDQVTGRLSIGWRALPKVELGINYEYRWVERTIGPTLITVPAQPNTTFDAEGHYVGLTLSYRPSAWGDI